MAWKKNPVAIILPLTEAIIFVLSHHTADARDVAELAIKLLACSNETMKARFNSKTFTVTGPDALSCADIAVLFAKILKENVLFINITEEKAKLQLAAQVSSYSKGE